jgi:hypothetical protein
MGCRENQTMGIKAGCGSILALDSPTESPVVTGFFRERGDKMRTYKLNENAGYKGCGPAFAKIERDVVIQLTTIDSLVSCEDYDYAADDDPAGDQLNATGEAKVQLFAEEHSELVKGMCSCGEFCV